MQKELNKEQMEKVIETYKNFYKTHLIKVKDRSQVLNILDSLCLKYQKKKLRSTFFTDKEAISLRIQAEEFLKTNFSIEILNLFCKEIPMPKPQKKIDKSKSFLPTLLDGAAEIYGALNEKEKQEWQYKIRFLFFLKNCLLYYGLHPEISKRNPESYKRFNFVLEHDFKSKTKIVDHKILLNPEILQQEFLNPYEKKLPIRMNGKLIRFNSIFFIKITSTLLLDDEIELYAQKHNFLWSSSKKDEKIFITYCTDETDNWHKNPYLISGNEKFRKQNLWFVDNIRIQELKAIKTKKFDLLKLVRLCEELNENAA